LIFREVEDRDLVGKARRGDVDAYNTLVSRWDRRVFNYILRLVRNREDAMDLSQEVFLKAYQNLGKLDDPGRFAPWLFRIAHNESFSLLRRQRPDGEELKETASPPSGPHLLPPQGFKFDEMAEILDCPVSTIKSRLYTALDLLKDTLAPVQLRGAQ